MYMKDNGTRRHPLLPAGAADLEEPAAGLRARALASGYLLVLPRRREGLSAVLLRQRPGEVQLSRPGFLGGCDFRETIWAVVAASGRRVQAVWDGSQFIWRRSAADVRGLVPVTFALAVVWAPRHPGGRAVAASRGGGQSSTGGTRACHGKDQHAG
jgi:hypothetical protein